MNYGEMKKQREKIEAVRKERSFLMTKNQNLVYQYRNFQGFWNIISGDSFWATNARFSNDREEQNLGFSQIRRILDGENYKTSDLSSDCYIVCFCCENDILSQWRGYTLDGGVSMGFDFNNIRPFYIYSDEKCIEVFNGCFPVQYIKEDIRMSEFQRLFDLPTPTFSGTSKHILRRALEIIPFVKHRGFREEKECRLVFSELYSDSYIRYRQDNGINIPYIIVKCGRPEVEKTFKAYIRIQAENKLANKLKGIINKACKDKNKIKVVVCSENSSKNTDGLQCAGCTKRFYYDPEDVNKRRESECEDEVVQCGYTNTETSVFYKKSNDIYISECKEQEKVFNIVENALKEQIMENKIKIWCEGHLPLRTITVGPVRNKVELQESIKHYCNRKYWLKYVEVNISKIPYRSALR